MKVNVINSKPNLYRGGTLHSFVYEFISTAEMNELIGMPELIDKFGKTIKVDSIRASIHKISSHSGFLVSSTWNRENGVLSIIRFK